MNYLGGIIKNKFEKIYKASPNEREESNISTRLDYEDIQHTLNVLQEENKILKSKVRILENSIIDEKSNSLQNKSSNSSHFGKFFKELKSTILYNTEDEPRDNLHEFKKFLYENMLLHGNIDEDDAENLNTLNFIDSEWEKNKEVYLFKQHVLEKNYSEMFKNVLVSNQLNVYLKSKGVAVEGNKNKLIEDSKDTHISQKEFNQFNESEIIYSGISNNKSEIISSNSQIKEKLSDTSVRDGIYLSDNKVLSPVNKPNKKDIQSLDIGYKLLSDIVIVENNQEDLFSKTSTTTDPLITGSNSSIITSKVKPTPSPINNSSRKNINVSNDKLKDSFDISSLLSDNNLTTSIKLSDIIVNRIDNGSNINNESSKVNQVKNNSTNNLNNIMGSQGGNIFSNKNKPEVRNSLLQFDMDEDDGFSFGEIIKSENYKEKAVTTNAKQSLINIPNNNKNESEKSPYKESNIFESKKLFI